MIGIIIRDDWNIILNINSLPVIDVKGKGTVKLLQLKYLDKLCEHNLCTNIHV